MLKQVFSIILVSIILAAQLTAIAQKAAKPEMTQLQSPQRPRLGFMIHGGAGVIKKGSMTPEKEKAYRDKLTEAVNAGYKALQDGKSGLDAVETAIRILEDSPLFNAGKGAVLNADGKAELDASIMNGKTLAAGGVAGLHHVKNPITLARAVMEKSPHVLMFGDGAEKFAADQKIEIVDENYFIVPDRLEILKKIQMQEREKTSPKDPGGTAGLLKEEPSNKFGTVGAVALDKFGDLAAGTSTGGMTNKKFGRVGDSPIIGAGTYANNNSCAVSGTGWGEYFIRLGVARDIAALMEYRALPIQNAADQVIQQKLTSAGGDGGVIAMDKFGNMAISFNSEGMFRAYIGADGKPVVEIYK